MTVQAGRCSAKEEGKGEKARVLRFALHRLFSFFFFFANYGYSKMEKVKGCLLSSLHKSILTPSVNGTILGEKMKAPLS